MLDRKRSILKRKQNTSKQNWFIFFNLHPQKKVTLLGGGLLRSHTKSKAKAERVEKWKTVEKQQRAKKENP